MTNKDSSRDSLTQDDSERLPARDQGRTSESPETVPAGADTTVHDVEPLTLPTLARFFAVPLLIIGSIVGGAVIVVSLFGAPSTPQQRTMDELLQALEASDGHRSMGMLLPREKEHWQTGLELVLRLREKENEAGLSSADLDAVAERLAAMIERSLPGLDPSSVAGDDCPRLETAAPTRLAFLIRALGLTDRSVAVAPLIKVAESGVEPYATLAIQQLGNLHAAVGASSAIPTMIDTLRSSQCAESLLTACTALSVVAPERDPDAIEALSGTLRSHDGEIEWAAALALARLGSDAGKTTLLDLLDRAFWDSGDRYTTVDETGQIRRYPMPAGRVNALLLAAIDAVSQLDDDDLWESVRQLQSDESPSVRQRAKAALEART